MTHKDQADRSTATVIEQAARDQAELTELTHLFLEKIQPKLSTEGWGVWLCGLGKTQDSFLDLGMKKKLDNFSRSVFLLHCDKLGITNSGLREKLWEQFQAIVEAA